jgi:thymidylate kinase
MLLLVSLIAGYKIMIIAFMGNDGTGKTTLAWQIHKFFTELGFEAIYKHEHQYVILRFLLKLLGKENKELKQLKSQGNISREKLEAMADSLGIDYTNKNDRELRDALVLEFNTAIEKSQDKIRHQKKRSVTYTVWPVMVWFDLLMQYLYYKVFKRRSVVLLDRYPYDHYLSFKYLGILTKFSDWLYLHFPKPDLHVVLTVSPQIAYERKKNTEPYSLCFYEKQTEEYLNLAHMRGISVINTNDNLQQTVIKVIGEFFQSTRVSNEIVKKANQNRVIFYTFRGYPSTSSLHGIQQALWKEYQYRLESFRRSLDYMRRIMDGSGVSAYVLIKTIDDYYFIGNDIDVLISPSDFQKLLRELISNSAKYGTSEIMYEQTRDVGKMDIFPEGGMKIDIHSYIGWGNMIFVEFKDLVQFIENAKLFDIDCKVLNRRVNSLIIAIHGFEKGYLTLDEFLFLRNNFDREYSYMILPRVSQSLDKFFIKLESILRNQPDQFPVFFPLPIFAKCYLKFLSQNGGIRKLHLFLRDMSLVTFWKYRYAVKSKLPFELKLFGTQYVTGIGEDNKT